METHAPARVLCVDDDANVLSALHRQLRHRYDVVLAQGAAVGRQRLLDSGPFAVVLSDLHMPGQDGLAFLVEARTIAPDTRAILMSGSDETWAAPVPAGLIVRRIAKPCLPVELWAALDAAIADHDAERPIE